MSSGRRCIRYPRVNAFSVASTKLRTSANETEVRAIRLYAQSNEQAIARTAPIATRSNRTVLREVGGLDGWRGYGEKAGSSSRASTYR